MAERLRTAGSQGENPFSTQATAAVHEVPGGVTRSINLLSSESLSSGYRKQRKTIERDTVEEAATALGLVEETPIVENKPSPVNSAPVAVASETVPRSMVDTLIDAMKTKRTTTQGVIQHEQVL